jgi:hypothetical protein
VRGEFCRRHHVIATVSRFFCEEDANFVLLTEISNEMESVLMQFEWFLDAT